MKNHFHLIFLLIVNLIVISSCAEKPEAPELSEIAATPKAPEEPQIPLRHRNDSDDFKQAVILLSKIRHLSNPPGSENQIGFQLSKETEGVIISYSREGIRLGKLVSDEYLDSIYPRLKYMFKYKLIKGSEIFYDGFMISLNNKDTGTLSEGEQKQILGVQLQIEWIEWFNNNAKSFSCRIFDD